jgi:phosphoglycolate phosphatase-like HAD superfamily hydrolase
MVATMSDAPRPGARLLLFDIDGTLLLSGGAGLRAMTRAFADVFAVRDAFTGIPMAGRTDSTIVEDALARWRLEAGPDDLESFRQRYYVLLREELHHPSPRKRVLAGVPALLDALQTRADTFVALLSGNFSVSARIKLEYFELAHHFRCGAYGDDAADRNALVAVAVRRSLDCGVPPVDPRDIVVVGDTPLDVACGQAAGATTVAVATGDYTEAALRASGADVVLPDFADLDRFLAALDRGNQTDDRS